MFDDSNLDPFLKVRFSSRVRVLSSPPVNQWHSSKRGANERSLKSLYSFERS